MECPFCTATLPDDDAFCEECGKPLSSPVAQPAPSVKCPNCGAPSDEFDEEGYCGRCGHLARRPASDHVELVLSDVFVGVSDRGLKHQRNEDRFAMRQVGDGCVMVVCDGVSSSTQSEQASSAVSEHVAQSLETVLRRHSASSPERNLRVAIQDAQDELAKITVAGPDAPSTTVVAALVNGLDATIGWAGDSRAYWVGVDGEAQQLTTDHSWMNDVVAAGGMTLEQASHSPNAHGITHWLGADAGDNAEADVVRFKIPGPGHLLLCTDGLWNYAQDAAEMGRLVHSENDPLLDVTRRLIDFANDKGGHDNITAILLRVHPDPPEENG
jgi:serine/threonine protein phosphatase PrpC